MSRSDLPVIWDEGFVLKHEDEIDGLTIGPLWRRFPDGTMVSATAGWTDEVRAQAIADEAGLPLFFV